MSTPLAIAAATVTLQVLLGKGIVTDNDLNDATVTALTPDRARGNNNANQLNLFLYQTVLNAAWRNADLPRQVNPGENGNPPLAVNLYYLITAYGRDNDAAQPFSHHLLGQAMSILHDHPVLGREEIKQATDASLKANGLDLQIERLRITPQPMSLEEISKLWTGFQTQYRLSAAYEVSVVLIDSKRPSRAALPVLMRGANDIGPAIQTDLTPPFPHLDGASPQNNQPSARLNEPVALKGIHLDGANIGVLFENTHWANGVEIAADANGTSTDLSVKLPNTPATWPAGFYTLAVLVKRPNEPDRRSTNKVPLSIAPQITDFKPSPAQRDNKGEFTLTVTTSPEILPEQRAALFLGDAEFLAKPRQAQADPLVFFVTDLSAGEYFLRIRVDGVDSILFDRNAVPLAFDKNQKLTVT
jgi:hypothetical protein